MMFTTNAINDLQESAESSYNVAVTERNFYKNRCKEFELACGEGIGTNFEEFVQRLSQDNGVPSLFLCESKAKIVTRFKEFKEVLFREFLDDLDSRNYALDEKTRQDFVNLALKTAL